MPAARLSSPHPRDFRNGEPAAFLNTKIPPP